MPSTVAIVISYPICDMFIEKKRHGPISQAVSVHIRLELIRKLGGFSAGATEFCGGLARLL